MRSNSYSYLRGRDILEGVTLSPEVKNAAKKAVSLARENKSATAIGAKSLVAIALAKKKIRKAAKDFMDPANPYPEGAMSRSAIYGTLKGAGKLGLAAAAFKFGRPSHGPKPIRVTDLAIGVPLAFSAGRDFSAARSMARIKKDSSREVAGLPSKTSPNKQRKDELRARRLL